MRLAVWDWVVIAVYAATVVAIGLRAGRKQHTSEGYFLAGRRLRWPFIGASIYAANISTEHFVGLAGCGYVTGLAFGCYEWIAVFCLIPLIVLFLPFYIKNRIYTVPEFSGTAVRPQRAADLLGVHGAAFRVGQDIHFALGGVAWSSMRFWAGTRWP